MTKHSLCSGFQIFFCSSFLLKAGDVTAQWFPEENHEELMRRLEGASKHLEARQIVWNFVGADLAVIKLDSHQVIKLGNFMLDVGAARFELLPKEVAQALMFAIGDMFQTNIDGLLSCDFKSND